MKYMVITSKHHDGFSMFDSATSDYDIVDSTLYGRDVMKALSRECKKAGIKFCFYHSILDWHHPAQQPNPKAGDSQSALGSDAIVPGRKQEYLDYMKSQLRELVLNYDPAVLWFDGEWVEWWTEEDGKALYQYLRALKPSLIINNRVGKGRNGMEGLSRGEEFVGDFGTPEQQIPARGLPGIDWESCITMNETWGYKASDHHWKSATEIVRMLVDTSSKGGNLLLNVGPTAEGVIPQPSVDRLREVGEWLRANGEAIYGAGAGPFAEPMPWGRVTARPGKLYLHVYDWPSGGRLLLPTVPARVRRAYILAGRARLPVRMSGEGVQIDLPETAPDARDTVIALELGRR
jgi:alpha-L-fucosidase